MNDVVISSQQEGTPTRSVNWWAVLAGLFATCIFFLLWLGEHGLTQDIRHSSMALVILVWSAGQLARVLTRVVQERRVQL